MPFATDPDAVLARYPESGWRSLYAFAPKRFFLPRPARARPEDDADGVGLAYLDEGPADAAPVVMVHGNPTWSFFFRAPVLALRERRRCLVPDHVGCGLSDKPQRYPYTLATHVDNLEAWLEAVIAPGTRVDLLLHDWGGAIGMGYATRHPERIRKIAVMNTAAWRSLAVPARIRMCRAPVWGELLARRLNLFVRLAARQTTVKPLAADARAGYLAPYGSYAERVAVLAFVRDIPLVPGRPGWEELGRIEDGMARLRDAPLLWQWGGHDWCFTTRYRDGWLERFPDARGDVYADAGHYLLEDAADRIVPKLVEFFG